MGTTGRPLAISRVPVEVMTVEKVNCDNDCRSASVSTGNVERPTDNGDEIIPVDSQCNEGFVRSPQ
jgi:hypothetical protein